MERQSASLLQAELGHLALAHLISLGLILFQENDSSISDCTMSILSNRQTSFLSNKLISFLIPKIDLFYATSVNC